jgi:hypothetical protein
LLKLSILSAALQHDQTVVELSPMHVVRLCERHGIDPWPDDLAAFRAELRRTGEEANPSATDSGE